MLPILYESAHLSIHTLWVFVVVALLTGSYLAVKRLKRRRVNVNLFIEHSTSFALSALIISRVIYFFSNKDAYFPALDVRTLWNVLSIWDQGLSLWGAMLGLFLMLTYRVLREKEVLGKWYDALSVPVLVGYCIGQVGAFLGGYAYGIPTGLPWGVRYEIANVRYTVPVHPTQIYAILAVSLLLWSKWMLKRKTEFFKRDGNTTLYLTSGFSLIYFLLEFLRGDATLLVFGIRLPMILAGLVFLSASTLLLKRYFSKHETSPTPES